MMNLAWSTCIGRYLVKSGYEVIGGKAEEAEELAITISRA